MKEPKNALFRVLIQTREGDKWRGKDWVYLTPDQARRVLISVSSGMLSDMFARVLQPTMNSVINSFLGIRK